MALKILQYIPRLVGKFLYKDIPGCVILLAFEGMVR